MSKRILVTGGAGFVGHNFISYLLARTDWEIVSLDRLDFSGTLNRLQDELKDNPERRRVSIVHHDLKADLSPWIADRIGEVDFIFHIAAGSHVDRSIRFPVEFVLDNVLGTANLLEFARKQKHLEKFIYMSTDECFGPATSGAHKEHDGYNACNPYAATKAGATELCGAYRNTYGVPAVAVFVMNIFGHRQHPEKFIPMTIANVRDGNVVTIHSNPQRTLPGTRFYIHMDDVSDALFWLSSLNRTDVGYKFNVVGEREISNLELARMIASAQDKELRYELVDARTSRIGHDFRYALDGSLIKSLGWQTKQPVDQRVSEVVEWSLQHPEWIRKRAL